MEVLMREKEVDLEDRYLASMLDQRLLEKLAPSDEARRELMKILRRSARAFRYPHKGEQYVLRGTEKRDLHFVIEGAIAVKRGSLTFRVIANDCIGIDRVFGDALFSADLYIARPDTLIVRVGAEQMQKLAEKYSALHRRVLQFMGDRVRECTMEVEVHRHLGVEARLARLLLQSYLTLLESPDPDSIGIHKHSPQLPYDRQALAEEVGTASSVISRTIKRLAKADLLEKGSHGKGAHWVRVIDPEGLRSRIKPLYDGRGNPEWFMPEPP
jgi:CRP-like cAMP-binding protein